MRIRSMHRIVGVLALGGLLAGCAGNSSTGLSQQSGLEAAAVAYYLPASYSDYQTRLPLNNFYGITSTKMLNACFHQHGFNVNYPYSPETYDWSDANSMFPDLSRMASDGVLPLRDLKGINDWVPNIPKGELDAFNAVFRGCEQPVGTKMRSGHELWDALKSEWVNIDAKGDADPGYVKLVKGFAACVKRLGYQGNTPVNYFLKIDELLQNSRITGKPMVDQKAISLHAGRVYVQCYRAANAYRQKIRQKARAQFMDEHALDIQKAQQQLEATVVRLSKTSGVKYEVVQRNS